MLPTLYKAVCSRLLQVDFTQRINLCCLCLETVGESVASVEDEVVLNLLGRPFHSVKLSSILKFLLDDNFSEVMFILKSVCNQCIKSAIAGYKFVQCCKYNVKILTEVVDNFEESFDEIIPNHKINCKSLYVALQPSNHSTTLVKRYYDVRRNFIPEDTALFRFTQIVESKKQSPDQIQDHININEIDHTLQALMCCKTVVDTKELLDDPDKPHEFRCRICSELFAKSTSLRVHFFRAHRPKDFKCVNCRTEKDTQAMVITQRQPVEIVSRLKNADLEHSSTKNVQLNEYPLESDIQLPNGDNDYQNDEQYRSENERDNINVIKIVPKKTKQNGSHLKINDEDQYIVKSTIEAEHCCENCGLKFTTRARYLTHCKKYKGKKCRRGKGRGEFKCDLCSFTGFYRHQVRSHIRVKHLYAKDSVCSYCNKICHSNAHLEIHLRKHTGQKPFHCDECGGKFSSKNGLKLHKYIHTGERPFKCEFCDKTFRTGTLLGSHIKCIHKPPSLSCKICGELFKFNSDLNRHEIRHYSTQPIKRRNKI